MVIFSTDSKCVGGEVRSHFRIHLRAVASGCSCDDKCSCPALNSLSIGPLISLNDQMDPRTRPFTFQRLAMQDRFAAGSDRFTKVAFGYGNSRVYCACMCA